MLMCLIHLPYNGLYQELYYELLVIFEAEFFVDSTTNKLDFEGFIFVLFGVLIRLALVA